MLKKIIACFVAVCTILSVTACSNQSDDFYTDSDGKQYIVVRDVNDNIVISESGKLQVFTLNENNKKQKSDSGEYITEYIDFNGQVVIGNSVETAEMRFSLPSNFQSDINNPGYFFYEPYNGEIFITYYNDDIQSSIDIITHNCENLLESYGSENFRYEQYSVTIGDIECTVFKSESASSEYYRNAFYYLIPYDSGYYEINCIINTDDAGRVNFDKFVKTIELK